MVHLAVHGFSWGLAYWLIVVAVGVRLDVINLRHAWRQVRAVRPGTPDRRPLGASTLGHLMLHLVISAGLIISGVPAALVQVAALEAPQSLDFANATSAVAVIGFVLAAVSVPTAAAVVAWLWRWNTVRALHARTQLGSTEEVPMPNQAAINALLVTQSQLADAAGAIQEAQAKVEAALAALRASDGAEVAAADG